MNEVGRLRVGQTERGLSQIMSGSQRRKRTVAADKVMEIATIDEFEHEKMKVLLVIEVVGADDMGMVQTSDRAASR